MTNTNSWLFLFAALGGIGGVGTIISLFLQVNQKMKTDVQEPGKIAERKAKRIPPSTQEVSLVAIFRRRLALLLVLFILCLTLSGVGFVFSIGSQQGLRDELMPAHIEATIKNWLTPFGYSFVDQTPAASDSWATSATSLPGHPVLIYQNKDQQQFLMIQGTVTIGPEHQKIIDKLSPQRKSEINHDLTIELARAKLDYLQLSATPLHLIAFRRFVPLTNSLTQGEIVDAVLEIVIEENLVIEIVTKEIGQ